MSVQDVQLGGEQQRFGTGLTLRVLGPTRVERDGDVAAIGGPRQRAVLTRLILAERQLITAERLLEDVWGDDAPKIAAGTLHSHLSLLRRALGDPSLLRRDGPGYVLDVPADRVDALVFQDHVQRARAVLGADPAAALALVEAGLDLWRGPAYADVADDEWAHPTVVRLDELRLAATELRFDALLAVGRHADAVAGLERAVDEHPLRERLTAQLLVGLYRSGRQVDALAAFDAVRERLLEEFGLDPGPELLRLQAAILDHADWLAAPEPATPPPGPTTSPAAAPAPAAPTAPTPPDPDAPISPVRLPTAALRNQGRPFVGRERELDVLRSAWQDAIAGHRRFVTITGEAGAGKTRLVSRFVAEAHHAGAIVMWGRATPEAIVPYEPIVEGLRTILRTVSVEAQRRVVEGRDALTLLLPDLEDIVPGVELTTPEVGTERYVLFETVADLLDEESALWPMIFVLDDLHCADALTLRLLAHCIRHERPGRCLLVGTARTLPHTSNPDLDAFLADLHRDDLLDRISLEGLDAGEVADLLAAGGWRDDQAADAEAVYRATGGNPFFVTELAAAGALDDLDADRLPESVREVLGSRLDRLDERTMRIVSLAAVAGPQADIPVLARAGGFAGDEVLDAVDTAIAAGVLTEDGPSGAVTFGHALVQQAVLSRLTRSRRSHLHLQIADGLADSGTSNDAELAHHLLAAGALAAAPDAMRAAIDAGHDAIHALAYEDGERWAERALAVRGSGVTDELRCEALLLRSISQRALGRREGAKEDALEAADAARAAGNPLLLARCAEALALSAAVLGFGFATEDPRLSDLLREALVSLPDSANRERAQLLGPTIDKVAAHGDLTARERLSTLLDQLPEADEHPILVSTAHLARRMAIWRVAMLDERIESDEAALAAAVLADKRSLELNALLYGFTDYTEAGDVDRATEWFLRFQRKADEVHQPVFDAFVLFIRASIALLRGRYDASVELCERGLELGRESHGENAVQAWAGHVYVRTWDRGELATLTEVVRGLEGPDGNPIWVLATACCEVAGGDVAAAQPALDRFVSLDVDAPDVGGLLLNDNSLFFTSAALLAELARSVGDQARAAVIHRSLRPYEGRIVVSGLGRVSLGPVARYAGIAATASGDLDEARRLLELSVAQCRHMKATPFLARSLWDLALAHEARGDGEAAALARDEARALAASIGMEIGTLQVAPAP